MLLFFLCIVAGVVSWIVYFLVFRNDLKEYLDKLDNNNIDFTLFIQNDSKEHVERNNSINMLLK